MLVRLCSRGVLSLDHGRELLVADVATGNSVHFCLYPDMVRAKPLLKLVEPSVHRSRETCRNGNKGEENKKTNLFHSNLSSPSWFFLSQLYRFYTTTKVYMCQRFEWGLKLFF